MANYLGEIPCEVQRTPTEWALEYIGSYGQIDGSHHKDWVLDQVARILHGTPVITTIARWGPDENNIEQTELRFTTAEPTEEYDKWVVEMKDGEDGPDTYGYDEGTPP